MAARRCAGSALRSLLRGARAPRCRAQCYHAVRCSSSLSPPLYTPVVCYYADWAEVPLPPGHRFPMHKYLTTRLKLEGDPSLAGRLDLRPSPRVRLDDLLRVHTAEYVDSVLTGKLSAEEQRVLGFPWSLAHVTRSLASTGGTVAAMHLVMRGAEEAPPPGMAREAAQAHRTAMQLAGGTHHAFRGHGEGFCAFNDIAVAAEAAIHAYGADALPILVIDLDVHQVRFLLRPSRRRLLSLTPPIPLASYVRETAPPRSSRGAPTSSPSACTARITTLGAARCAARMTWTCRTTRATPPILPCSTSGYRGCLPRTRHGWCFTKLASTH